MEASLTYDSALAIVRREIRPIERIESKSLTQAEGRFLAESLLARIPNPRFDNSAVDGYAVGSRMDGEAGSLLTVVHRIAAGAGPGKSIRAGTAARILTGAPLPPGAYGIAMQEDVEVAGSAIRLKRAVTQGAHFRRAGTDFAEGEVLLGSGAKVNPGVLALLASQGMAELRVYASPKVGILVNGDELVEPGEALAEGSIYDTNSPLLASLVRGLGAECKASKVGDSAAALRKRLTRLATSCDLVVIAGGASVGDKDYAAGAIRSEGRILFHGVAMRPGKPILFGNFMGKPVFGLPGNPGAAFVCFHLFVREAILRVAGSASAELPWIELPFQAELGPCAREDFVRAVLDCGLTQPAANQGSFGLRSLALANCIVRIPPNERSSGIMIRRATLL